jgi:DNA-binding transcriptional ArsR family regulator
VTIPSRHLDDARVIRALAHPVRLALLQLLIVRGPLTATEAGETLGESPASASFHLRTLAKYGYVEEAGAGPGRRRPWRAVRQQQNIEQQRLSGEAVMAGEELSRVLAARGEQLYEGWLRRRRTEPEEWRGLANEINVVLRLASDEAAQLNQELEDLLARWTHAVREPEPDDARRPVLLALRAFPLADDGR